MKNFTLFKNASFYGETNVVFLAVAKDVSAGVSMTAGTPIAGLAAIISTAPLSSVSCLETIVLFKQCCKLVNIEFYNQAAASL